MNDLLIEFENETGINGLNPKRDAMYKAWLERKVFAARALGTVYIYPSDWKCSKMGGHPGIDDYETIDLSDL